MAGRKVSPLNKLQMENRNKNKLDYLFIYLFIIVFTSITIYPPYTPLPTKIATLLSMSMSPFTF